MFYFFPSNQMPLISFSWCIALAEIGNLFILFIALIEEEGTDILISFLIMGKETFAAKCKICSSLFADALYQVKAVPFWCFMRILLIVNISQHSSYLYLTSSLITLWSVMNICIFWKPYLIPPHPGPVLEVCEVCVLPQAMINFG